MRQDILISLLERAATEPLGLVLTTNNVKALHENYFNAVKRTHPNPAVRSLIFCIPARPNELFICQPHVDLEVEPETDE